MPTLVDATLARRRPQKLPRSMLLREENSLIIRELEAKKLSTGYLVFGKRLSKLSNPKSPSADCSACQQPSFNIISQHYLRADADRDSRRFMPNSMDEANSASKMYSSTSSLLLFSKGIYPSSVGFAIPFAFDSQRGVSGSDEAYQR